MKNPLTTLLIAVSFNVSAQLTEAPPPPDLHLAGMHIEKAGGNRNGALLAMGIGVVLSTMMLTADSDNVGMATGLGATGFVFALGLNISANSHERKAGRILQGKP